MQGKKNKACRGVFSVRSVVFFVMMLRYPGVMVCLPVHLFGGQAWCTRNTCTVGDGYGHGQLVLPPLLIDANWGSDQNFDVLPRSCAKHVFSEAMAIMCAYIMAGQYHSMEGL